MSGPVVPAVYDVSEAEFHARVVLGLERAARKLGGDRPVAAAMDLSTKQVGNIKRGASTDPKRLFDLNQKCPGVLDDIADAYGVRIVPKDAICTSDVRTSSALVTLLAKVIDAEADGSIDHVELLGMEWELRTVRAILDRKLSRIGGLKAVAA